MTIELLKEKLNGLGISPNRYSLNGDMIEGLVLESSLNHYASNKSYECWNVFSHERGSRYDQQTFYTEHDACEEVYKRLERYKTK